jgi:nicotinate-nucleotide adenylyltransferase
MGGTFDPIHIAHLIIAEVALEQCGLDRVLFVPSARPPHKHEDGVSSIEDRIAMVRVAIEGNPRLGLSDIETRRKGKSYTIETIRELKAALGPNERICFIMGADSLTQLSSWKAPEHLLDEVQIVVVRRPGVNERETDPAALEKILILDSPLMEISSSDIRRRAGEGRSIRYLVPPAVESYIREKNLYS